eukprot:m.193695 g.193695  ORF g.193695 m.193695 type:complete len:994 (-) comp16983_c0_seq4:1592-4573(-)
MALQEWLELQTRLLQLEQQDEVAATEAQHAELTLAELEAKGVVLRKMKVAQAATGMYGRWVVEFVSSKSSADDRVPLPASKFSSGDLVAVRASMQTPAFAEGVVTRASRTKLSVAFESADKVEGAWDSTGLILMYLSNTVTYRRLSKTNDMLLQQQRPGTHLASLIHDKATLNKGRVPVSDIHFTNPGLNPSQQEAIKFALTASNVAVIHGPPGTGKTTTVVELIQQHVRLGHKVLVAAPSNMAIDNVVIKLSKAKINVIRLGHPARLLPEAQRHVLDAVVRNSDASDVTRGIAEDITTAIKALQKKSTDKSTKYQLRSELTQLRKELRQHERRAVQEALKAAQVVCGTTTTVSLEGPLKHLPEDHFDVAVVDEAGQALEMACWTALSLAPRAVLAGDHLQLPPTITSKAAAKEGLNYTLLERVVDTYGDSVVKMLDTQYRMHACIQGWSSTHLYDSRLQPAPAVADHLLAQLPNVEATEMTETPFVFVDTSGCGLLEDAVDESISKSNQGEAVLVVNHVEVLLQTGLPAEQLGVITPYNMQVEAIRTRLQASNVVDASKVEVRSVDGFQGREKEAIVISLVRSNSSKQVGFLRDYRRLNVGITRARRHVFVTGDSSTLAADPHLSSLLDYMFEFCHVQSAREYGHLPELNIRSGVVAAVPAAPARMTDEEDVAFKQSMQHKIEAYLADHAVWKASTKLNSHQRRLIHILCEELDLHHASVDVHVRTEAKRQLIVGKTQADLDQFIADLTAKSDAPASTPASNPQLSEADVAPRTDVDVAPHTETSDDTKALVVSSADQNIDSSDAEADMQQTTPHDHTIVESPEQAAAPPVPAAETETQRVLRLRAERLRQQQIAKQDQALLPAAGDRTSKAAANKRPKAKSKGKGKKTTPASKSGHRLGGTKARPAAGEDDLDALVAAIENGAELPAGKPVGVVDTYIRQGLLKPRRSDGSLPPPRKSAAEQRRHDQLAKKLGKNIASKATDRTRQAKPKK